MPKKRHTNHYSKPPTTSHHSLSSSTSSNQPPHHDSPSVNELISSLRAQHLSKETQTPLPTVQVSTSTLPPSIRHLLAVPETPPPKPRNGRRRRYDDAGNLLPAGPAPPRSWLERSQYAPSCALRPKTDLRSSEVEFLPGLGCQDGENFKGFSHRNDTLQSMVMRNIARQWEYISIYEKFNLKDLPTRLRMTILSQIAVNGPDRGVGSDGLRNLLLCPSMIEQNGFGQMWNGQTVDNDDFFRLDLSRSLGRSLGFKEITSLVTLPDANVGASNAVEEIQDHWEHEVSLTRHLQPILPHLTHLSLSHPLLSSTSTSWSRLLGFAKHTPTITHLSLAFWPAPTMTPHSTTTFISNPHGGKDIRFSGTGYYAHSLDGDFTEAAAILRRLSTSWYALVYLDLRGCHAWIAALRWNHGGIDWLTRWQSLKTIRVGVGLPIREESSIAEVQSYRQAWDECLRIDSFLSQSRKGTTMIDVVGDDFRPYADHWKSQGEDGLLKRKLLRLDDMLWSWNRKLEFPAEQFERASTMSNVFDENIALRNSLWEQ